MPETRCAELNKQAPFIFDNNTILIGHSLGAVFILDILNRERTKPIKKAILVSGFLHQLGNPTFDTLAAPFINRERNRDLIKKNAEEFIILNGENDPYVPLSEAELLQEKLGGRLEIIPNGGHLNEAAGFTKFEEILKFL
jgi:predicted alpha/beta hydrolase family esterase